MKSLIGRKIEMKPSARVIRRKISVTNENSVIPSHKCPPDKCVPDCVFEQLRRIFGWKI